MRLANYLLALGVILTLNFLLPRLMPGDPLQAIYGDEAMLAMSAELKAELVQRFHLDQSWGSQFWAYLLALLRLDLGYSYFYHLPVSRVIMGTLPWTLLLAGSALVLSILIGIILGIESGWRRGSHRDQGLLAAFMFLIGLPDFFIGIILLLLFGVGWAVLPLAGGMTPHANLSGLALMADVLKHLVLPMAALTFSNLADTYLLTRNAMVATLKENFILTARAKGLKDPAVRYRHAGKNALLPPVTQAGIGAGRLFTGALFVEIVFSYPGIGSLMHTALLVRDYPLLQGILLVVAVMVLFLNSLTDLACKKLDPRIDHAR